MYELLAPGITVVKADECKFVIKEPVKMRITVRKSDMAKFGPYLVKDTQLAPYAERRPKTPTFRVTEDKIANVLPFCDEKRRGTKRLVVETKMTLQACFHQRVQRVTRPSGTHAGSKVQENPSTSQQHQENPISIVPGVPRRSKRSRQKPDFDKSIVFCPPVIAVPQKKSSRRQLT